MFPASLKSLRVLALCVVLALPVLAASVAAQERWAGWDRLPDTSWRFDPDDRPFLGYSVRTSPSARAALDAALAALAEGDEAGAARQLVALATGAHDDALQVAGEPPRWVGAAEYALYLLSTRVQPEVLEGLAGEAAREQLAVASAWRDLAALRRLAHRYEGLPEGRLAAERLARHEHELGADASAPAATGASALDPELLSEGSALRPLWSAPLVAARLVSRNPFDRWPDQDEAPIGPVVPLIAGGTVFVADSLSVSARELHSGRLVWHHAGPLETLSREGGRSTWFGFETYMDGWRDRAVSPYLCAEPALAGDVLVAVVQAREARRKLHDFETIPINWPLPLRRLVALDRATGRELWRQQAPADGDDFLDRLSVAGPPALGEGLVVAAGSLTLGAISSYAVGFELQTGALLWRTLLCTGQQDLTMFNRPFQEHTASPALLAEGAAYVSSNLGSVACVDARSGRLRWITGYEPMPRRASRSPNSDVRRAVPWTNHPPLLVRGTLIVTPLDSAQLLALDAATGRLKYTLGVAEFGRPDLRHDALLDAEGRLILVSGERVEVRSADSGALLWERHLELERDVVAGPASLAGKVLLVPTLRGLRTVPLEDRAAPLRDRPWDPAGLPNGARRAVPAGTALLLVDDRAVHGVVDVERALDEVQAGGDEALDASFASAELLLAAGRLSEAARFYDELLQGGPGPLFERARTGRLQVELIRARADEQRESWEALLELAERLAGLNELASEALSALANLGEQELVAEWIERIAERDPELRLAIDGLTRDGPQPAGLLAAQRSAEQAMLDEEAGAAVALVQELLLRWPDESWAGQSVRVRATTVLGELLGRYGRGHYARFEREAEALLAVAVDERDVRAVEARYPQALAVVEAHAERVRELLAAGSGTEALAALSALAGRIDPDLREDLQRQAAAAAGEAELAAALQLGAAEIPRGVRQPRLPALPSADVQQSRHDIVSQGQIEWPAVTGRPGASLASVALGLVRDSSLLFLIDAAQDRVLWRRAWPSEGRSGPADLTEWQFGGERLFAQLSRGRGAGGATGEDQLEALALSDGRRLWAQPVSGLSRGWGLCDGLVVRLAEVVESGQRRLIVEGFGAATGALVGSVELPPCLGARLVLADGRVLVMSIRDRQRDGTPVDARLLRVDLLKGRIAAEVALGGQAPTLLSALDEPAGLLLAGAIEPPFGSRLELRRAEDFEPLWQAQVHDSLARGLLFGDGLGGVVLVGTPSSLNGRSGLSQVLSLAGELGPGEAFTSEVPLRVLGGQSAGPVAFLALSEAADPARLLVVDVAAGRPSGSLRLPEAPAVAPRIAPARDGFALLIDPLTRDVPATLRLVDGRTGEQRYSIAWTDFAAPGRAEMTVTEGAVLIANGGVVRVLRSASR
ncbi:MAG: outer membrane protein assembly factor BamB family protein [Planctomycetota bacterium]